MSSQVQKRLTQALLAAALTTSVAGLASAFFLPAAATVAFAAATAVLCSAALAGVCRPRAASNEELVEKAGKEADAGRKLVIYERTTGLLAHWYLAMRTEEECARGVRYGMSFALAVLEPAAGSNEWALQGLLAEWLRANSRRTDLAGYAGNGRFLVLMPQTNGAAAETVLTRLRNQVANVESGLSLFPADGASFEELYSAAQQRLMQLHQAA